MIIELKDIPSVWRTKNGKAVIVDKTDCGYYLAFHQDDRGVRSHDQSGVWVHKFNTDDYDLIEPWAEARTGWVGVCSAGICENLCLIHKPSLEEVKVAAKREQVKLVAIVKWAEGDGL